jgi:hypothetical protein
VHCAHRLTAGHRWGRKGAIGRGFAPRQRNDFSFYRAIFRALEIVESRSAAAWMCIIDRLAMVRTTSAFPSTTTNCCVKESATWGRLSSIVHEIKRGCVFSSSADCCGRTLPSAKRNQASKIYHAEAPARPGIGSDIGNADRTPITARQPDTTNKATFGARNIQLS